MSPELKACLEATDDRVETAARTDGGIWALTLIFYIGAVVWVVLGPGTAEVDGRARAIAHLWPLFGLWTGGLTLRSFATARARRDLIRTYGFIAAGEAAERARLEKERQHTALNYPSGVASGGNPAGIPLGDTAP